MKTCAICQTENTDEAVTCVACGEGSFHEGTEKPKAAKPAEGGGEKPKPDGRKPKAAKPAEGGGE